ncbi:MAG: ATP-dependent protease LonB [Candidatus Micrarchaeia archaeon]
MAKARQGKGWTTARVPVPEKLIDQIIGQERAVEIVKKAAKQRRNVLLIGVPGSGKSMLAQAMAELMPVESLQDVLVYPNPHDENNPLVKVVPTYPKGEEAKKLPKELAEMGQGRRMLEEERARARMSARGGMSPLVMVLLIGLMFLVAMQVFNATEGKGEMIIAAAILGLLILGSAWLFTTQLSRRMGFFESSEPKLIIDNTGKKSAPFVDATGSKAGALFGDVKHDPLQSGGMGTPAHLRVEAGAIHRANKGVLYLDEVASLSPKSQQDLLTAMQEKKFPITGQSEMSSGAIVRTEPVPCDFVLVAAGNVLDVAKMHPALRSRIRGYGYEVYVEESMPDSPENRKKLLQFIAQEVKKDGKIPHFTREAAEEIIEEAKRKAGRKNRLTLRLRELGGLIRAAGDIAQEEGAAAVTPAHIAKALRVAGPLEQQIAQQYIDVKKDYQVFVTRGSAVGKVNGLAVMGDGSSGLIMPIVAEVTPASSKSEGKLIATGKLGKIAREAVENVSAIIKKHIGRDVSRYDIHVQFLQSYEGVEGDSASISIAVSVISAMEGIPVAQDVAMTGSLSVRGEVLPVGSVTPKIEAAIDAGAARVIIPFANKDDVYLHGERRGSVKVIPVKNIVEVLAVALAEVPKKKKLLREMRSLVE